MQEAFVDGYWDELVSFTRSLFNSTFKTNPWLERGIMTGITRVSKASIFSDLNNLEIVTTTSDKYATSFGFTEQEVFSALESFGLGDKKEEVKHWYDGFIFGKHADIYNPWSILNYLDKRILTTYWANTSSNSLVGKLIREGSHRLKEKFESLLQGESTRTPIDEQIVYNQLNRNEKAVWGLLLTSGYLKVLSYDRLEDVGIWEEQKYELTLTNILEFKVHDPEDEETLKETVQEALRQIQEKQYAAQLEGKGIPKEHIRCYGFAQLRPLWTFTTD